MSSRIRTYTRVGKLYVYLSFFCFLFQYNFVFSNDVPRSCPIRTGSEPIQEYTTKSSGIEKNTYCPNPNGYWWPIGNAFASDDQYTSLTLSGLQKSNCLDIQDFDFDIPPFSSIEGIQIIIEGHTEGSGVIKEEKIQLLGTQGEEIGENRAGAVLLGDSWVVQEDGTDETWVYTYDSDTWGAALTPEIVTDENFGIRIQLRNYSFASSSIFIDKVQIKIHYTPPIILCGHECMAFFVDTLDNNHTYHWYLPPGFEFLNANEKDNIINMGVSYADYGLYEICVETISNLGVSTPCCRNFIYDDCRTSSIGDFVWEDLNGNGLQDLGEPGLADVALLLFDENDHLIQQTITDALGKYLFADLQKGDYYIQVNPPASYSVSPANVGLDDSIDSDISELTLQTPIFYLEPGVEENTLDVGLSRLSSISGLAWEDLNADGIRSADEPLLSMILVHLYDAYQMLIDTELTGLTGEYNFEDLSPGSYHIEFQIPDSDNVSLINQGTNEMIDNDADTEGKTEAIILTSGEDITNIDLGLYKNASLGDFIWVDLDRNGIQDIAEPGIGSMAISLFKTNGELLEETVSNSAGEYLFEEIMPGSYFIRYYPEENLFPSLIQEGNDENLDSDITGANGMFTSSNIILSSGENNLSIDGGFVYQTSSICGKVWEDIDANGIFEHMDILLDGINISIYDENGLAQAGIMSSSDGSFCFDNLNPGNYYLAFEIQSGYIFTLSNIGFDTNDSDVTEAFGPGTTDMFLVEAGETIENMDAGLIGWASIGDYLWLDLNEDGIQNDEDSGINRVDVQLETLSGEVLQITTTQVNPSSGLSGYYTFNNILPGEDYLVRFLYENEFQATIENQSTDDIDSDITGKNGEGTTDVFSIISSQMEMTIDGGLIYKKGSVSGTAWNDLNFDDTRQSDEELLADISVKLYEFDGSFVDETFTNAAGNYIFENINIGSYYIVFETLSDFEFVNPNSGTDDSIDSDVSSAIESGSTNLFDILPDTETVAIDVGYKLKLANISGLAWVDENLDGIRAAADPPVYGIVISLFSEMGVLYAETTSHELGTYSFTDIIPGNYYVVFELLPGLEFTIADSGNDDTIDSDITGTISTGSTDILVLLPGANIEYVDAGYVIDYGSITGMVWEDVDYNGIRTTDEPRIENVKVSLYHDDGTLQDEMNSQPGGFFSFIDVPSGTYYLVFESLEGFQFTLANQGTDVFSDSDVTGSVTPGSSDLFNLPQGGVSLSFDAGYVINQSDVNGFVWLDENFDGIQNNNELGIANILVELFDEFDGFVAATTTNSAGFYLFQDQLVGGYYIKLTIDESRDFTLANIGDENFDSDITGENGAGTSHIFTIIPGGVSETLDAGIVIIESDISGFVWSDNNFDGMQDPGEPGVENITVNLFNEIDNLVSSTITDSQGNYSFSMQTLGNYYIVFDIAESYGFSPPNIGSEAMDSDVTETITKGSTDLFTIEVGGNSVTFDAGIFLVESAVSGYVWLDANLDGIQDIGELGVENVTVSLYNESNNLLDSELTDALGNYLFTNIPVGTYYLIFEISEGRDFTLANIGLEEFDSDVDGIISSGSTALFAVLPGGLEIKQDAGLIITQSNIMGMVWMDANRNGIQDVDELGVANLLIELYDDSNQKLESINTNESGLYFFTQVDVGSYYLVFAKPDGTKYTIPNAGTDANIDSDVTGQNGEGSTDIFTILPGGFIIGLDAGFIQNNTQISGIVWEDKNGNGIRDEDLLISDVFVELYTEFSELIGSTMTNNSGEYNFSDIDPGSYYIKIQAPGDYTFTDPDKGANESLDSDITESISAGSSDLFELSFDEQIDNLNGGLYKLGIISGIVWNDSNENGIRENEETGINGISVYLYNAEGSLIAQTITFEAVDPPKDGCYAFSQLAPGSYTIQFESVGVFVFSEANIGGNDMIDSDVIEVTGNIGVTDQVMLMSGGAIQNIDAGLYELPPENSQIGDFVWHDINGNGIQDMGEPGFENIAVTLFNSDGTEVLSSTTNSEGFYLFTDLLEGEYYLEFEIPDNYYFTEPGQGGNDAFDSDVTESQGAGTTDIFLVAAFESNLDIDAGIYEFVSIGDYVWNDGNGNGIQDNFEVGIDNIAIRLFDEEGNFIRVKFTGPNPSNGKSGYYLFENLPPGKYYISSSLAAGLFFTDPDVGGDDAIDSDINSANGFATSSVFEVLSGEVLTTIDVGMLIDPAKLGDYIWLDINGNGVQDAEEPGINNIEVNLYTSEGEFIQTTTSTNHPDTNEPGYYNLGNVGPGSYYLEFIISDEYLFTTPDQGGNDTKDSDVTNGNGAGTTSIFSLDPGELDFDLDAGIFIPGAIGDFVWFDENSNGIQDSFEDGVSGIEVTLFDGNNMAISTVSTNEQGLYCFDALKQGLYFIKFNLPDDLQFTAVDVGSDDSIDSDAFPSGVTPLISLAHSVVFKDMDAGVIAASSLVGNRVWLDVNADGIQGEFEEGMMDVKVSIFDNNGVQMKSTFTDVSGEYIFDNLADGEYYISFEAPVGYQFSQKHAFNNDEMDSDANPDGNTDLMFISSTEYRKNVDAGLYQSANFASTIWEDENANGIYDNDEIGLTDVLVKLFDNTNNLVAEQFSQNLDKAGIVEFSHLKPGIYYMVYEPGEGYLHSYYQVSDSLNRINSDVLLEYGKYKTENFELAGGKNLTGLDAGFYKSATVGNKVWFDSNRDGIQSWNEKGQAYVGVVLYDETGFPRGRTVTDENGEYLLDGMREGNYYLRFLLRENEYFSPHSIGIDGDIDCDVSHTFGEGTTNLFSILPGQQISSIDAGVVTIPKERDYYTSIDTPAKINPSESEDEEAQTEKLDLSFPIVCYPNPSTDKIQFEIDVKFKGDLHYQIIDEKASLWKSNTIKALDPGKHTLAQQISSLPPGKYYLVVEQSGRINTSTFIVADN